MQALRDNQCVSPFPRQRAQAGTRPQLQPIPAWSWMLAAVTAVAVTALVVTIWLLAIANGAKPGTDQANARLDAVRTGLAAGAGAGAAVGLMLAFRRQHHQEIATAQTDHDATERRITELYTKAVEQLGNDKAPVRLGGLYALERLSQDNEAQRQTIVNVICAYLRMPFPPQSPASMPTPDPPADANDVRTRPDPISETDDDSWQQEKQVRLTAQRILSDHLRKPDHDQQQQTSHSARRFWDQISLDFTGATLIDFDLAHCMVTGDVVFRGAIFSGTAEFSGATFSGTAEFSGAAFSGTAEFSEATFSGTAWFSGAAFSGTVWFSGAAFTFRGAAFSDAALFRGATFSGTAWFSRATFSDDALFTGATFSDAALFRGAAFSGTAWFNGATFSGTAEFSEATFSGMALFSGAAFSDAALFSEVTFSGTAEFSGADFGGTALFSGAAFSDDAEFSRATFSDDALFSGAAFSGTAEFREATFSGTALFSEAAFSGDVLFRGVTVDQGSDAFDFARAHVHSSEASHVWPTGWHLESDSLGEASIVRSTAPLSPT